MFICCFFCFFFVFFLIRTTILAVATHICTLPVIDQTTKNSIKCIRFDVLVWIIGSSDALLLLCTISAHLIQLLVQVSLHLVTSVAGICNRFLFLIIEHRKDLEIQKIFGNLKKKIEIWGKNGNLLKIWKWGKGLEIWKFGKKIGNLERN